MQKKSPLSNFLFMRVYRSRIGWEIWIPVMFIIGFEAYLFISNEVWHGLVLLALFSSAMVALIIKTRYIISDDNKLNVKCWFIIDLDIDIKSIHRIRKTYNPLSSPAAALIGRIEVFYDTGKSIIISPKNRKVFIADLLSRNQSIMTFEA